MEAGQSIRDKCLLLKKLYAPICHQDTMLTRFTGTPENKAALVTGVPMARLGLSEELANAIVFIASNEASFITGHILNVDGGHSAN
jgi:NAD(P)-dependent dehydrogenase (short-subunit alcohol dehydrogenase family)